MRRRSAPHRWFAALPIIPKTQILLALVLVSLLVGLYGVLYQVVAISFTRIERDAAIHAVLLLEKELQHQQAQIAQITTDYAVWDDTYGFLRGAQPQYVARNLSDATFVSNRLDLILLLDNDGGTRYRQVRGPDGALPAAMQAAIAERLIHSAVVEAAIRQEVVTTSILDLPEWPVVVSAHPVLQSDYAGPSAGLLIMGRRLDTDLLAEIEDRLSATVRFQSLAQAPTAAMAPISAALQAGAPHVVTPEGSTWVHGATLIRDVTARPVLIGEITQPRTIWAAGRQAIRWTLASFIAAGVLFAVTLTFVLQRVVLRRLAQLIAGVQRIGAADPEGQRVLIGGHDELSQLAATIHETLSTVADQRAYLTALYETTLDLLNNRQLDDLLQAIVDRATVILDAPYGELMIREGEVLVVRAYTANQAFLKGDRVGRDEARLAWEACASGQPVTLDDYATWAWRRDRYASLPLRAVVEFPILVGDSCRGVLALSRTVAGQVFTPQEIWKGQLFSHLVALVLENAHLYATAQHEIAERATVERALHQSTRELQAQNAELDAFGHTVAHDLKTPLTAIIGYGQLLQLTHRTMAADSIDADLHVIMTAGHKMKTIINALLLLATVRQSEASTAQALDMAAIVAEVTARLTPEITAAQATLSGPLDWPGTCGHAPWVEEVWVNYVSNALKYGGDPPQIVLGADPPVGGFVRCWVRDNGPGIAGAQQALLFRAFTRLQPARADGHGLGLSIVSRIVEKLGGRVGVESTLGAGSTFFFTLPVAE